MKRHLLKAAFALLAMALLAVGGALAWSEYRAFRWTAAVDRAEADNAANWETGAALRITARLKATAEGQDHDRERTLDCFRKQVVERGDMGRPVVRTVSEGVGYKAAFVLHSDERIYYIGPAREVCAAILSAEHPRAFPIPFAGSVIIEPFPREETSKLDVLRARLGPACRLDWSTGQPISLGGGVQIDLVEILSVEEVPMQRALSKPEHMGTADATILQLAASILGDSFDKPAWYDWNDGMKCWLPRDGARCATQADDLCGIPRL